MTKMADASAPFVEQSTPKKRYVGVRGWLLFLCFLMVVVSPAVRLYTIYEDCLLFLDLSGNAPLASGMATNFRYAVGIEMFLLACTVVFAVVAGLALFRKQPHGPRLAKLYWASGPVVNFLLLVDLWIFLPSGDMFRQAAMQTSGNFIGTLLGAVLWIWYLNKSRRVKATYTQG